MKALDLFCGAGGAAMGLHRAGFDVTGVDIRPQPHFPFRFIQGDALTVPLDGYDLIWASPPCQAYTISRSRSQHPGQHPDLVEQTRARLKATGVPWVIENVPGAPLPRAVLLCGATFGLGAYGADGLWRPLRRHRLFETSITILTPPCQCEGVEKMGIYGHGGGRANRHDPNRKGYQGNADEAREALGIDWMTRAECAEAIPPAFSECIARAMFGL